jgi:hypothetical protein
VGKRGCLGNIVVGPRFHYSNCIAIGTTQCSHGIICPNKVRLHVRSTYRGGFKKEEKKF